MQQTFKASSHRPHPSMAPPAKTDNTHHRVLTYNSFQAHNMADPGPLGLAGFALTTFVISCYNAGIFGVRSTDPINVVTGLGIFYGGIAQVVAGMWEFKTGNTFAATAFSSYGAFWLAFSALLIPGFGVEAAYQKADPHTISDAKGIFLLGWTIFTFLMLVASLRTTVALAILFCFVAVTFVLLTVSEFGNYETVHRAAGFVGIITAAIAWYNALAGLLGDSLPLGGPIVKTRPRSAAVDSTY